MELKGVSFEERYKWVQDQKAAGNELYKAQKHEDAITQYERAMMGLGFPKDQADSEEIKKRIRVELQAPLVNNISMCAMKQGHYDRACRLLTVVLQTDPTNFKAVLRQSTCLEKLGQMDKAKGAVAHASKMVKTEQERNEIAKRRLELAAAEKA